ncbi:M20/M25/M40 family metallo-hydrolase [Pararhodonellum marinum]|uniref:M20/M25/M40 family metallo-hydrolase n=1 Tax=Pararhodonellum marinum TaxID=2755358 RepID=UPI00188F1C0B|nr:M20/M25/M40 family metallo-hydrolase [Pararhodonellum marinum]
MKKFTILLYLVGLFVFSNVQGQTDQGIIDALIKEAEENSQLENLAYELLDVIGPRLVGTPQMKQAHDWAVAKYGEWGISARNEQWGEWRGWERGITHIDMVHPRTVTLEGTQLAWSPSTKGKAVTAEVIALPDVADSIAFQNWLSNVKGKYVMISMPQPTGRPDDNWKEFGTEESIEKMRLEKAAASEAWANRVSKTGLDRITLPRALEKAGAVGIVMSYWSNGWGANKIFGANTKTVPTIDLSLEDYGMLYRLVENGAKPQIRVTADSKELGAVPTFNTIAEIKGVEKPDEYVILSAHFDSWDGGTGATDNGTGTIVMMEVARLLKLHYPNPKRTILVGLWGSEEQGLNGSRSFVEDHPEIVAKMQALFNQDNGTGRVVNISGQGFLHAYEHFYRWLAPVPEDIKKHINTNFPGFPGGGGSDYASFVAAGAPGFSLSSLSWDYGRYTWHTQKDTYDKIVFDDVRSNAILTAILTYMACEEPELLPRDRAVLPASPRTGQQLTWPQPRPATRKGGLD